MLRFFHRAVYDNAPPQRNDTMVPYFVPKLANRIRSLSAATETLEIEPPRDVQFTCRSALSPAVPAPMIATSTSVRCGIRLFSCLTARFEHALNSGDAPSFAPSHRLSLGRADATSSAPGHIPFARRAAATVPCDSTTAHSPVRRCRDGRSFLAEHLSHPCSDELRQACTGPEKCTAPRANIA